jgi:hypothetical protein
MKERGDDRYPEENMDFHRKVNDAYRNFFNQYLDYGNVFKLHQHEDYCKELVYKIDKLDLLSRGSQVVADLIVAMYSVYNHPNKNINNYRFNWHYKNADDFQEDNSPVYILNNIRQSDMSNDMLYEVFGKPWPFAHCYNIESVDEIQEKELYEQCKILNDLYFNSHIQMSKYGEGKNSRRFLATNDSCMSSFQVLLEDDAINIIVNMRSASIKNNFPVDVAFVYESVGSILAFFNDYEYRDLKMNINELKVNISIDVGSLHYPED